MSILDMIAKPENMWRMGWLRLVGSLKLYISFAEYRLFYKALLAKETYNFMEPTSQSHPVSGEAIANRESIKFHTP